MKTKLLSLLVTLFVTTALWAYDFKSGDLYYNITNADNHEVEVTYQSMLSRNYGGLESVTIPATITHAGVTYSVTTIGDSAFYECLSLTSITIPNSITSIGNSAFNTCFSLTSITIPNSITRIESHTFFLCTGLTSITIPESVTSIGDCAFYACWSSTSITIPDSVRSIGSYAFYEILNIVYSGNAMGMPWGAKSVNGYVEGRLVYEDDSKTNLLGCNHDVEGAITLPNTITSIGKGAFMNCYSLTSVMIPGNVISIGESAFENCQKLTSVTIPEGVRSIEKNTFFNCGSLTSVIIPDSVTSINDNAFLDVSNIIYHGTASGAPWGARSMNGYVDGNFVYEDSTRTTLLTCCRAAEGSISIPNSVTSIENMAFYGCPWLTSITIPNSVTSIGYRTFTFCHSLTSITIPESVTSIGDEAFWGCSSLTSITIPNGVTTIGSQVFGFCNLLSITIPSSVESILGNSFSYCESLSSIVVEDGNLVYDSRDNCNAIIETATNTLICGCYKSSIPNGVTSIGWSAFCNCTSLTSITIPNSVTYIDSYAFYGCTGLTSITIPDGVESILDGAFWKCSSLSSITIPSTITRIRYRTFEDCSSLTSITIPNSVTYIDNYAFSGCTGLTSISILAENPPTLYGENIFGSIPNDIPFYIPCGTSTLYQTADHWSKFTNYIEELGYSLTMIVQDSTNGRVEIIKEATCADDEAVFEAIARDGYRFLQWSDGNTDNPRHLMLIQDTELVAQFISDIPTDLNDISMEDKINYKKISYQGQMFIVYNGDAYTITGIKVNLDI